LIRKTIIYWRDIPSQVVVQKGRKREKALLSSRFQEAIDRAAMRAGKGSSNAYLEEWRREASSVDSDDGLQELAEQETNRIEKEFSDDDLLLLIRNHGSATEPPVRDS
jgi:hypothetical protein